MIAGGDIAMTWKKRDKGGDVLRRASLLWRASLF